jgi:TRAP-type C4-dicarboxylate transport system permease small subunit
MMKSVLGKLLKIEGTVAAVAFALAAAAVLSDVIEREVFGQGIWGSTKFAVFAAAVAGFLGIGLATHAGMQLRPQFADGWMPKRLEPAMRHVAPGITAFLFFAIAWYAGAYVYETYQYGQLAPVLDWPLWMIQIVMPYAFISNGLRNLIYAIDPDLTPKSSGIM